MLLGLRSLTEEKTVTEASKESCKGINIGRINFDTVVPERGLRTNMQIDKSSALKELLFRWHLKMELWNNMVCPPSVPHWEN